MTASLSYDGLEFAIAFFFLALCLRRLQVLSLRWVRPYLLGLKIQNCGFLARYLKWLQVLSLRRLRPYPMMA